jgi:hypothetical protein
MLAHCQVNMQLLCRICFSTICMYWQQMAKHHINIAEDSLLSYRQVGCLSE